MFFWYLFQDKLRILNELNRGKNKTGLKKKLTTKKNVGVRFVREQKVFGKGAKAVTKKKTNVVLRILKVYFMSGPIQNAPPFTTLFSLYGINSQKLAEELTKFFKLSFFEGVPVTVVVEIFKDFTFKFDFLSFRFNLMLQTLNFKDKISKVLLDHFYSFSGVDFKFYSYLDLWFLVWLRFSFFGLFFKFESFLRTLTGTLKVLQILKFRNFILKKEKSNEKISN